MEFNMLTPKQQVRELLERQIAEDGDVDED
jgi:hypothetical protein